MMKYVEKRYLKLNRYFLLLNGLWPYQSVWSARLMRTIFIFFTLTSIIFQVTNIFITDMTREFFVIVIQAFLVTSGILCHICVYIKYIDKFKGLFEHMWQDWALQKTENEIKIFHEHAKAAKLFAFCYTFLTYGVLFMYFIWLSIPEILDVISPMNESRPRRQPFEYDFFIDEERYFYLIRLLLFISTFILPSIYLASSTLFVAFSQHVCAMYKLLGYRAEYSFYVIERTSENDLKHRIKIRCRNIAVLVQLHYNIIQFVDTLETCYTVLLLLDLLACVCGLSITLTQIPNFINDMEVAIRSTGLTLITLCYLFIHNYMGQKITDISSSICEKLYNSPWYDAVISEQNSVLLIMRRCIHPYVLTACKFYTMSLQSFGMVLQTSVSYCMFLKQM